VPHGWLQQLERWLTARPDTLPPFPSLPPKPPPAETERQLPTPPPAKPALPDSIRLIYRKNPRARRYVLRVTHDGTVLLTIPRGGTEAFARRFAIEKEAWIREQLDRFARNSVPLTSWAPGSLIWFRGQRLPILVDIGHAQIGDFRFPVPSPIQDWRAEIEAHFRALAASELPPLVLSTAQLHSLTVRRIQVRNQRSRWGSCSKGGTISLNWRLVQLPESVRDYLVAHELAHLRQMNHSQRFWAVVDSFCPTWRESEKWLSTYGRHVLA